VAVMSVSDQVTTVALALLKATVLLPCVVPNPLPLICTCVPTGPAKGEVATTWGATALALKVHNKTTTSEIKLFKRTLCSPADQVPRNSFPPTSWD
jgi:hypothetical protein